jgi:hypothetical protein
MLHKDCHLKGSVGKITSRESQGAWRQDKTNLLAVNRQSYSNYDFDFDS